MIDQHAPFVSPIRMHIDVKTIALRDIDLPIIIRSLNRILPEIETLQFKYIRQVERKSPLQESASFVLEYGTIPILNTLSAKQHHLYYIYSSAVIDATKKAIEWFPHNLPELDEMPEDWLPGPISIRRSWATIEINVLFNQPCAPDAILLEFNRISGCHWTPNWIFRYVANRLTGELQFEKRLAYLQLLEGCDAEHNHINWYLFNEYICREVCSHWQPNISVLCHLSTLLSNHL